jgi:tocopherol O-methyltransferase
VILPAHPIDRGHVADHYDELDRLYREVWGEHLHHGLWSDDDASPEQAVKLLVREVAARAGIDGPARVCDVGCGYGATARQLADEFAASVTAITLSAAQHRFALAAHGPRAGVRYLHGDWLSNALEGGAFDAVVAIESTEHIDDKARCFAEIARVLRPGGGFAICAWLAADDPRAWHVRHLLRPICSEGRLPALHTSSEYAALIAAAGLDLTRVEDWTAAVARTWTVCLRRVLLLLGRERRLRRYLLSRRSRNRDFAPSLLRIRAAYALGAMRYGVFSGHRP